VKMEVAAVSPIREGLHRGKGWVVFHTREGCRDGEGQWKRQKQKRGKNQRAELEYAKKGCGVIPAQQVVQKGVCERND